MTRHDTRSVGNCKECMVSALGLESLDAGVCWTLAGGSDSRPPRKLYGKPASEQRGNLVRRLPTKCNTRALARTHPHTHTQAYTHTSTHNEYANTHDTLFLGVSLCLHNLFTSTIVLRDGHTFSTTSADFPPTPLSVQPSAPTPPPSAPAPDAAGAGAPAHPIALARPFPILFPQTPPLPSAISSPDSLPLPLGTVADCLKDVGTAEAGDIGDGIVVSPVSRNTASGESMAIDSTSIAAPAST